MQNIASLAALRNATGAWIRPLSSCSPTLTYNYGYDYSFKRDQHVSVLTLDGRVVVSYTGYDKHIAFIKSGAEIGAAKLFYDKPKQQFYLLVALAIDTPDPDPETHTGIAGVDVGVRYLVVSSDTRGNHTFHSGKQVVARANHYARTEKASAKERHSFCNAPPCGD